MIMILSGPSLLTFFRFWFARLVWAGARTRALEGVERGLDGCEGMMVRDGGVWEGGKGEVDVIVTRGGRVVISEVWVIMLGSIVTVTVVTGR